MVRWILIHYQHDTSTVYCVSTQYFLWIKLVPDTGNVYVYKSSFSIRLMVFKILVVLMNHNPIYSCPWYCSVVLRDDIKNLYSPCIHLVSPRYIHQQTFFWSFTRRWIQIDLELLLNHHLKLYNCKWSKIKIKNCRLVFRRHFICWYDL